jgi:predicted nucleic acid-binding protein
MSSIPRIYCDANPIIELAKKGLGTHDLTRLRDLEYLEQMLKASNNLELELFTSSISVAECVAAGQDWSQPVQEFFTGVLSSGSMFKLVQDSIFVAEQARQLRWKHNISLKGMDAIHVASAIEAKCEEFLSWDAGIASPRNTAKTTALALHGIKVIAPSQSLLLPTYYVQTQPKLDLTN